ncbi:hypothetical protein J437_LFUL004468 [Ladona fulva]|uniref:PiggyBac transposable element-derived protein domain-containing protein n=1 Tax=Ladona fulva TaxID=123851 RepID=A0A8K0JZE5_LADFU|nr:hypothetical protein J437_LFUL004468 [Ladona fulva]
MGGVDKVEQHLSHYPIPRKRGKKYYRKIFFHLMEQALWNSYVLYKKTGGRRTVGIQRMVKKNHSPEISTKRGRPSTSNNPLHLTKCHFQDIVPETGKKSNPARQWTQMERKNKPLCQLYPPFLMNKFLHHYIAHSKAAPFYEVACKSLKLNPQLIPSSEGVFTYVLMRARISVLQTQCESGRGHFLQETQLAKVPGSNLACKPLPLYITCQFSVSKSSLGFCKLEGVRRDGELLAEV